jgi:hypothetical protein
MSSVNELSLWAAEQPSEGRVAALAGVLEGFYKAQHDREPTAAQRRVLREIARDTLQRCSDVSG